MTRAALTAPREHTTRAILELAMTPERASGPLTRAFRSP